MLNGQRIDKADSLLELAEMSFRSAADLDGSQPTYQANLAVVLYRRSKFKDALDAIKIARSIDNSNSVFAAYQNQIIKTAGTELASNNQ